MTKTKRLPDFIKIIWHIEDVQEVRPDLGKAQCRRVSDSIVNHHDACRGVTWDTLKVVAAMLFPIPDDDDS